MEYRKRPALQHSNTPPLQLDTRTVKTTWRLSRDSLLLLASTCAFSWLAMQVVHEAGHVLHAWASGGTVVRVVLHPLQISRTDVQPNPHSQFVAWAGAIWGCLLPLAAWLVVRRLRSRFEFLPRFFAGFCCVANGCYLGVGAWFPVGDAADLLRHGAPRWTLAAFGLCAVVFGLWLWNGVGHRFGIGSAAKPIDRRAVWLMTAATVTLVVVELAIS